MFDFRRGHPPTERGGVDREPPWGLALAVPFGVLLGLIAVAALLGAPPASAV